NTVVLQVFDNEINYYINGHLFSTHGSDVYPEVAMSLNFNLWFIPEQIVESTQMRQYHQEVDWVYFNADKKLSHKAVLKEVANLRARKVQQQDTVPHWQPKLDSYCGL
ncbi:MAG: hydrolase, partial [Colwellia sp.]|nr:hydrolase [Colwellia sp.]